MLESILTLDNVALVFAFLMGFSMLVYAILDGYDLGVGILSKFANDKEKDLMIKSITPFWDANETWLVLGVGLMLVAFPKAYGIVLSNLYLPVFLLLFGLIIRGIAFDFRVKVPTDKKNLWNNIFFLGSSTASFAQGFMLGKYILSFDDSLAANIFAIMIGFAVIFGYSLVGAGWLIMKTEGKLQIKSAKWALNSLYLTAIGIVLISVATPLTSTRIYFRWFDTPEIYFLSIIPFVTLFVALQLKISLCKIQKGNLEKEYLPFILTIATYILCFIGLAYSFYPYIIPGHLLIIDATISLQSLIFILIGAIIVIPILLGYTFFVYKTFHGKVK